VANPASYSIGSSRGSIPGSKWPGHEVTSRHHRVLARAVRTRIPCYTESRIAVMDRSNGHGSSKNKAESSD